MSSPSRRCIDTLRPLATAIGSDGDAIEVDPRLRDTDGEGLVALLGSSAGAVLCTHGEVMEPALAVLRSVGLDLDGDPSDEDLLLKGAAWSLDPVVGGGWRLGLVVPIPLTACPHHAG